MSMHQSKTAAPAHAKIDRHHVDIRPVGPITSISDVYMGMGGTVQGHLSNGASTRLSFFLLLPTSDESLISRVLLIDEFRPHRDDHRDGLRWFPPFDDQPGSGARPRR